MGFNHAMCGFDSVGAFADAMKESEGAQLLAFVGFVKSAGLSDELRNKNWAAFARGYNGAAYKKNNYDTKMAAAYKKFLAQKDSAAPATPKNAVKPTAHATPAVDAAAGSAPADSEPIDSQPATESPNEAQGNQTAENIVNVGSDNNNAAVVAEDEPFEQMIPNITKEKVLFGGGIIGTGIANVAAWAGDLSLPAQIVLGVLFLLIVAGFIWLVVTHRREIGTLIREAMGFKADKSKNSPVLTTEKPTAAAQTPGGEGKTAAG